MIRNISWNMLARLVSVLLGFPEAILVAHALGPQGQGIYRLALLIPALMGMVVNLGLNFANVYFVGQDERNARVAVANSLWASVILGCAAILLYAPLAGLIHDRFLSDSPQYLEAIGVVMLPISLMNYNLAHVFNGLKQFRPTSIWTICTAVLTLLGAALVSVLGLKATGMVALYALVVPVATIAVYLWILRRRGLLSLRGDLQQWLRSIGYGIRGTVANLLQFLNFRLDSLIIAAFLGATEVGLYSLAVLLTELLWLTANAVATILFPVTAGQSPAQASRLAAQACRHMLWVTLAEAVILAASARWLVPLIFGQEFAPSVLPLWLLLPGTVALAIPIILNAHMAGRGRPQIGALSAGISLVATVALDLILIPRLGIAGAAIASSVAYILTALVVTTIFRRATGVEWSVMLLIRMEDWRTLLGLVARGRAYLARRGADLRSKA